MPYVSEVMSLDVKTIEPHCTLREAATLMRDLEIGALPVCQGDRLLGMLTDRDIAVRGVARGLSPGAGRVSDVMSDSIQICTEDEDTETVMRLMGTKQIRRLPVVDADGRLVGIVSVGDLALRDPGQIDEMIEAISEPGRGPA